MQTTPYLITYNPNTYKVTAYIGTAGGDNEQVFNMAFAMLQSDPEEIALSGGSFRLMPDGRPLIRPTWKILPTNPIDKFLLAAAAAQTTVTVQFNHA